MKEPWPLSVIFSFYAVFIEIIRNFVIRRNNESL